MSLISFGDSHSLGIDILGNVWSWGHTDNGKIIHISDDKIISIPQQIDNLLDIIEISCGLNHSCCLDSNGLVWGFGNNLYNQLGNTNNTNITQPIQIEDIPLIKSISCENSNNTYCISIENDLWSLGDNQYYQLGHGSNAPVIKPKKVKLKYKIASLACGESHVLCITINNKLIGFGNNKSSQLSLSDEEIKKPTKIPHSFSIISISCGREHSILLSNKGNVYTCGNNKYGQLGIGIGDNSNGLTKVYSLKKIQNISCGFYHSYCIDIKGNCWLWGCNINGQLGLIQTKTMSLSESRQNKFSPQKHPSFSNSNILSKGGNSTIIQSNKNIYAFGSHNKGELGVGNTFYTSKPVNASKYYKPIFASLFSSKKSARK